MALRTRKVKLSGLSRYGPLMSYRTKPCFIQLRQNQLKKNKNHSFNERPLTEVSFFKKESPNVTWKLLHSIENGRRKCMVNQTLIGQCKSETLSNQRPYQPISVKSGLSRSKANAPYSLGMSTTKNAHKKFSSNRGVILWLTSIFAVGHV